MMLQQVIAGLGRRLVVNAVLLRGLAVATLSLYAAFTALLGVYLGLPVLGAIGAAAILGTALILRGKSLLRLPDAMEAGRVLDEALGSKNRAAAYLDLQARADACRADPLIGEKKALLDKQLSARLSGFDAIRAAPFRLPAMLRRLLYPLPFVMGGIIFLIIQLLPQGGAAAARVHAKEISELIRENPLLPEGLKRELKSLASALSNHDISSGEVSEALEQAEAELAAGRAEMTEEARTVEVEKRGGEDARETPTPAVEPKPTPSAETEPKEQEAKKEKKKEESEKSEQQSQEGSQGEKGQAQTEQSKDEQQEGKKGEGQGEGKEGGSEQQKGEAGGKQQGAGEGQSETPNGQQGKGSGAQAQQQQQESPGEGTEKEEKAAQAAGGGGNNEEQKDAKQESLSKVERSLNQLNV